MRGITAARIAALSLPLVVMTPVLAQEAAPGRTVKSLLDFARGDNPEFAAMRSEADASAERVTPAGALADPKFRVELRDITRLGSQSPTLLPGQVGSTRYLLMQDVPWSGKRDLRREIAALEAEGAKGRAAGTWVEVAAKIKAAQVRRQTLYDAERLVQEILDLTARLEQIAQARYAGGLAAQQDVIRAQIEQTGMRGELVALQGEKRQVDARLNALLARPASAPLAEPDGPFPPPPDPFDQMALAERLRAANPSLFAEESRIKAAEKGRDLAYRNRYPDFTFGLSPIQSGGSVKEWELMVELNIPLQQDSRRAQERESGAMLAAARSRREALANQLLADLAENLAAIEAARRSESLIANSLLPQAESMFRAALAGYETGKADFSSVLDAQRHIRQARQSRLQARSEAQMRLTEIERLVGEAP